MSNRPLKTDLTGQRFGRLLVLERAPNENGAVAWKCICDCGKHTTVRTFNLLFGQTKSCGCYRSDRLHEIHSRQEGVGTRYGKLTVVSYDGPYAIVRCDCGTIKKVQNKHLLDGSTKSCGCLRKQHAKDITAHKYT